jgi:hypothetical protein
MTIQGFTVTLAVLCLLGSGIALAGSVRCTTWESTVTPPPGQTCTGRLHKSRQWEGRCR